MLKLFSNRSIAVKLASMTVVGAICMALVAATVLLVARSQLVTERTEKAHAIADAVWQLAEGYRQMAVSGKITEEEAKKKSVPAAKEAPEKKAESKSSAKQGQSESRKRKASPRTKAKEKA